MHTIKQHAAPGVLPADRWHRFGKTAVLACPGCGRTASLLDHHIADDGKVSPSVDCPNQHCDFHKFVILEGWDKEYHEKYPPGTADGDIRGFDPDLPPGVTRQ
jgi:hypothetical protein